MSKIDLTKRVEKVGLILEKRKITNIACQVKLAIDRSGSMSFLYDNGTVQDVVERILAVSLKFDKDGTIDIWAFNNESFSVKAAALPLIDNYVKKEIEAKVNYGGTSYAPAFRDILKSSQGSKGFFGFGKKEAEPTLAVFITDGENDDRYAAEQIILESENKNIYWLLVGIGDVDFYFIQNLGAKYANVGFIPIKDISAIDDEDLYNALLNEELAAWFQKFK